MSVAVLSCHHVSPTWVADQNLNGCLQAPFQQVTLRVIWQVKGELRAAEALNQTSSAHVKDLEAMPLTLTYLHGAGRGRMLLSASHQVQLMTAREALAEANSPYFPIISHPELPESRPCCAQLCRRRRTGPPRPAGPSVLAMSWRMRVPLSRRYAPCLAVDEHSRDAGFLWPGLADASTAGPRTPRSTSAPGSAGGGRPFNPATQKEGSACLQLFVRNRHAGWPAGCTLGRYVISCH